MQTRLFFLFLCLVITSCSDYDSKYDYKLSCQKDSSPYGVWLAKKVGPRSVTFSNGNAQALYRVVIKRDKTYTFCDTVDCTQNVIKQEIPRSDAEAGAFLRGFLDDPVTKSFRELTGVDVGTRITGSYLDFNDMSCMPNARNQYCENKQCIFFGSAETINWFVFIKTKDF